MEKKLITKTFSGWLLMLFLLITGVNQGWAQNVTIKATNGSTIPARKDGGAKDTFFGAGGFATWQHEQLSMVLTTSDGTVLTPNEQLDNPANNLFTSGNYMQIGKGQADGANVCYISLSLPKGYRFTGYEIKFKKSTETKGSGETAISFDSHATTRFGETDKTFSSFKTFATVTNNGGSEIIKRSENGGGAMGNVLYFRLDNTDVDQGDGHYEWDSWYGRYWVEDRPANNRALITLESAEFFFTAEENYTPVTPAGVITSPVSAVDIPFATSKVDYGRIEKKSYLGYAARMSYDSKFVSDLEANFVMYEEESTTTGTNFDGTSGKVVEYKPGSISSNGGYFQVGGKKGDDGKDVEQVYYIETPSYIELSDGTKNPVGYRIVSADFEYDTSIGAARTFYITWTRQGTTYYLNTEGRFRTTKVVWEMDNEGYISSNGAYLYFNNGYANTRRSKPAESERFAIDDNNGIYQIGWPDYYIRGYRDGNRIYGIINPNDDYRKAVYEEITPATEPLDNYKIVFYDEKGEEDETVTVTGHGTKRIPRLNNDAVKFGVIGTGLIRGTLTLQALDPYLDMMSVVCQDQQDTHIRLSQDFTASDFSVSGGVFHFFLPESSKDHTVAITFEDLASKYFDETYPKGNAEHTSRLNFVKSDHFNVFGLTNNNIYNNRAEAANASEERRVVGIVGTKKFKFNNASELGDGDVLTEYPFTLEKYAASPNYGTFDDMKFTVSDEDQSLTRYVFTTDETRYNIAPTTAVQHRAYAFYEMEVHVMTSTYDPKIEFTKIYDKTCYDGDKEDAFYGAIVTAPDGDGNKGYASTVDIYDRMSRIITTLKKDDTGNTDIPTSLKNILYVDFSNMKGLYIVTDENHQSLADFLKENAKNCLLFLPEGTSTSTNNAAYQMESGNFHASQNIVITDKQPFYSPYNITLDAEGTCTYTRQFTTEDNGQVQNATVMLPFTLAINNGVHENEDGLCKFTVHTMKSGANMSTVTGSSVDYGTAFFQTAPGESTEANVPYMIRVDHISSAEVAKGVSFIATQKGASIDKTQGAEAETPTSKSEITNKTEAISTGKLIMGESANASFGDNTYSFKNYASYSGAKFDRAVSENVFYFIKNKYVDLHTMWPASERYLYSYPFRGVYTYTTSASPAKMMKGFYISYDLDEMEDAGLVTTLDEVKTKADMMIRSGKGFITITATEDNTFFIRNLSGMIIRNVKVIAGNTTTVNLPAGIYLVNNTKITVK